MGVGLRPSGSLAHARAGTLAALGLPVALHTWRTHCREAGLRLPELGGGAGRDKADAPGPPPPAQAAPPGSVLAPPDQMTWCHLPAPPLTSKPQLPPQ